MTHSAYRRFTKLFALLLTLGILPRAWADDPTKKWSTLVTPHFYIHYYRNIRHDEAELAQRVAQAAETAHRRLSKALKHAPSERTHMVITDDTDSPNGSAMVVPLNLVRLFMTGPSSINTLNDYDNWIYGLILHEYTHILHIDTIHGLAKIVNYVMGKTWAPNQIQPGWFLEGMAIYFESIESSGGRLRNNIFDMYMRAAVLEGHLLELDQISSYTRYFPRGDVRYLYGSFFLKYLADRFGEEKLIEMSHRYGGTIVPYSLNRLAQEVFGFTYEQLYQDFKEHLRKRYAIQRAAVEQRGLTRIREITTHGDSTSSPVFSADGQELVFQHSDGYSQRAIKILDLRRGQITEQYDAFGGSGLSVTPDGQYLVYGESRTWRSFYSYDDLFVRHRPSGRIRRLTSGLRARDPAVSPDGRQVAFVTNDLGTMSLAVIPFQGGEAQVLFQGTNGDQVHTPRWSPDGQYLAFSRWQAGGYRDIYLLELQTRQLRRLTADRALDIDPVFSPDGRRLYFSSDRTGIYNIFCLELEKKTLFQVSNILGGAFNPAVSPDEKQLYYVGFSSQGYDLHAMDLDATRYKPALPYVSDRPAPSVIDRKVAVEQKPYNPFLTLYPRNWSFRFGSDAYGTTFGIDLRGSDVVGRHSWGLSTTISTTEGEYSYGMAYTYTRFWPGVIFDTSRYKGLRGGVKIDGEALNYREENYGGGVSLNLPVLRVPNHFGDISFGYRLNWFRNIDEQQVIVEPGMISPTFPRVGLLSGATFGLYYSSVRSFTWSISAEEGRMISLYLRVDHPSLGSDFKSTQATYSWNEYVPLPWLSAHVLALRLAGGIGSGDPSRRGLFFIGGFPDQDVLRSFFELTRIGGAFLRGYPPGALYGDQYHLLNVEYRFPLLNIEKGASTLPLYFTHIHMAAFTDVGNAFFEDPKLEEFKVGVGAEMFVEGILGYFLPVTFRVGYARGVMEGGGNAFYFMLGNSF